MQNPFTFNNVTYQINSYIGVTDGEFIIEGVNNLHPIGFDVSNSNFSVISGTAYGVPVNTSIYGSETLKNYVQHYTETITIKITGDVGIFSYHCYNHGYMGGQNKMKYYVSDSNTLTETNDIVNPSSETTTATTTDTTTSTSGY